MHLILHNDRPRYPDKDCVTFDSWKIATDRTTSIMRYIHRMVCFVMMRRRRRSHRLQCGLHQYERRCSIRPIREEHVNNNTENNQKQVTKHIRPVSENGSQYDNTLRSERKCSVYQNCLLRDETSKHAKVDPHHSSHSPPQTSDSTSKPFILLLLLLLVKLNAHEGISCEPAYEGYVAENESTKAHD